MTCVTEETLRGSAPCGRAAFCPQPGRPGPALHGVEFTEPRRGPPSLERRPRCCLSSPSGPQERVGFAGSGWGVPHLLPPHPSHRQPQTKALLQPPHLQTRRDTLL